MSGVVTSVLPMARTADPPSPAKAKALKKVAATAERVRKGEASTDEDRTARNEAIVEASEHAAATEIAEAAKIKQSYVSRVIRSGGKPGSGSALDKGRDA